MQDSFIIISIVTLAMLSPGPDFFIVIKNATAYRRSAAMMTGFGVVAGITTHMTYCVAGVAVLIAKSPLLFDTLKYAGAAYLAWVGIQALMAKSDSKVSMHTSVKHDVTLKKAFMQGYWCNLLNPKATLFFLALFTQMLDVNSGLTIKLWYAFIVIALAVIWWPLLIIIIQSQPVRKVLSKIQAIVDKVLGAILVGLAIKVAFF